MHHFKESDLANHMSNWRVSLFAVEPTSYGPNYFMKVLIGGGLAILIRVHKQQHHDIWRARTRRKPLRKWLALRPRRARRRDFHSLHKRIVDNTELYVWAGARPAAPARRLARTPR